MEVAVGMGDEGPGKTEYPRIAGEWSLGQLRQLTVVACRQVIPNLADLLVDEVVVVEKPLGGWFDVVAIPQRGGARTIGGEQNRCIVPETGRQGPERRDERRVGKE